jgi:hypothetical protein
MIRIIFSGEIRESAETMADETGESFFPEQAKMAAQSRVMKKHRAVNIIFSAADIPC